MSSAFIVGATGAVGSEVVKLLAESTKFKKVLILARRPVKSVENNSKFVQKIIDFENIGENSEDVRGLGVAFCALGTTRGKAGADGFKRIEHDYVMNSAKLAKENGVKQFVLVSSRGADENSSFLYFKTKGKVEREIAELGFEKFIIMRPGMIETKREEFRLGEIVGSVIIKPMRCFSDKHSSSAVEIAKAMIYGVLEDGKGTVVYDNPKIIRDAKKYEA